MCSLKHVNHVTKISPAGYVFKVRPMYMPFDQSLKIPWLPCALTQLHHNMDKATTLSEGSDLSAHTVQPFWRWMAGESRAGRLYCCLAQHKYEKKSWWRTAHVLYPTLHSQTLMQTTSKTMTMIKAIGKSHLERRERKHWCILSEITNINSYIST